MAFIIVFLNQGANRLATTFNVGKAFPDLVVGILIFFIIGCEFFIRYKVHFRKRSHTAEDNVSGEIPAPDNAATGESGGAGNEVVKAAGTDDGSESVRPNVIPDKEGRVK